jgi:hypothetical protein
MTDEGTIGRLLCGSYLELTDILAQIDYFVALSQGNMSINHVELFPYQPDLGSRNYELWDKVGQGVGNLKSLIVLRIYHCRLDGLDWQILARILPYIQNKITLQIDGGFIEGVEDMRAFARAIQGHPAITHLKADVSFECTATLCSTLTTLPNLESVILTQQRLGRGEVPTFQFPESMTDFLRAPSLRVVEFRYFCFTGSLCLAAAMALRQGSSITSLVLVECSFPEGGSEQIAGALKENATLTTFKITPFLDSIHQAFYDAMATSLLSNSTLQELSIRYLGASHSASLCITSLLLALGMNRTLRKLHISGFSSVGGLVIPALREGLGKNSTLEILELIESRSYATVSSFHIAAVEVLQLNKTLKTLRLRYGTQNLTDDEAKHLTSIVKKNYGLESLPELDSSDDRTKDLRSILRLNEAGRRYLPDGQGSVVSKGVGILSAVSDDLNCVFLHLLENPSLCKRGHKRRRGDRA